MGKLFGTDGVRGEANIELTSELAYELGRYGAHVLTKAYAHKATIVVGKDTRISGYMLESALVAGILSSGCDAVVVGVTPTPAIPHLIKHFGADAGVMISASHNPVEFNGIKFFNREGFKLTDTIEEEIESYIFSDQDIFPVPNGIQVGRKSHHFEANRIYAEFLKTTISHPLKGIKVAMDCANGASFEVSPALLRELGAEVTVINNHPDGLNINLDCGSTHPDKVAMLVKSIGADIGLSFDGDADRLIAVDELGNVVDGDKMLAICGGYLKSEGQLKENTIVTTVMSNMGLDVAMKAQDIHIAKTKVGDRYVLEEMMEKGYVLGGEQSGHIIFLNHNTTGDGLLSALQLMNVMKATGKSLSQLASVMTVYPQVLKNARVSNAKKHDYLSNPVIKDAIAQVENQMNGQGRVLIRPSGTEPLVRVMLEGKDQNQLNAYASELVDLILREMGE